VAVVTGLLLEHPPLRRALTIPLLVLATLAVTLSVPVWLPLTWLASRRLRAVAALDRCTLLLWSFLLFETGGAAAAFVLWVWHGCPYRELGFERPAYQAALYRLQHAWAGGLFAVGRRLFRLHIDVEGGEAVAGPPALIVARHASLGDTVLPIVLYRAIAGHHLAYVLKRELLLDPCLDLVGNALPNAFVDRTSEDGAAQREAVARLVRERGPDTGILIYPEGTRFSPERREAALAALARRGEHLAHDRARRLRHVLPPRHGGVLALLEAAPDADVLFCAHHGFEGARRFTDLARGAWLDTRIRVRFWRVPAGAVPASTSARRAFLDREWERMDRTIGALADPSGAPPP
jgi:1-acyl-sn-glycerol-3-phosphate acyltransferase